MGTGNMYVPVLENHCTRTVLSSQANFSRQGQIIMYLAVKMCNICVIK